MCCPVSEDMNSLQLFCVSSQDTHWMIITAHMFKYIQHPDTYKHRITTSWKKNILLICYRSYRSSVIWLSILPSIIYWHTQGVSRCFHANPDNVDANNKMYTKCMYKDIYIWIYLDINHGQGLFGSAVVSGHSVDSLRNVVQDQIQIHFVFLSERGTNRETGGYMCTNTHQEWKLFNKAKWIKFLQQ